MRSSTKTRADRVTVGLDNFKYWPCFCEENVWHLCQHPNFADQEARVAVISNTNKTCALWHQRSAATSETPIVWDYHVVLCVLHEHWTVWDPDSTLPLGTAITEYLSKTFPDEICGNEQYAARFRVIESLDFVLSFSSDRSHMLDSDGNWMSEPPPWPPILHNGRAAFDDLIDMRSDRLGDTLSLPQMKQLFAAVD